MTQTTALTLPQRAAVALGSAEHEKRLALLVEESKTIREIKNGDAREQCHAAYMRLKNTRVTITNAGKAARDDATKFSKAVIAEEARLIAITEAEEARLQGLRDQWDSDREAERQAKIEAERQRVAGIRERIEAMRTAPLRSIGKHSAEIRAIAQSVADVIIDDTFAEFHEEAMSVRSDAFTSLESSVAAAESQEAEGARLAAEREELARLRAEAEARRIEQDRIAAEARAKQEAELAAERQKQADELAAERAEMKRQQAERDAEAAAQAKVAREAHEAAEAKLAEERAELERQQAALKAVFDKQAEAERARLQTIADQALADAREPVDTAIPVSFGGIDFVLTPPPARLARPSDADIIEVVARAFGVDEADVVAWILDMDAVQSLKAAA